MQTLDSDWGCPSSHHGKHFTDCPQRPDCRWEAPHCSKAHFSKWLRSTAYLTLAEMSQQENTGIGLLLSAGFEHASCLGFFYFFFLNKIRDEAGNYLGRRTEGGSGHTCSSYGDKRRFFEAGLLLWVLLETTFMMDYHSFVKIPITQHPGITSDYQNCWTAR